MADIDTHAAAMGEIAVESERGDRNEATTRLQLIDRIFFDALGWRREHCRLEDSLDGTFTDYSFGVPGTQLIVEAKKEGITFELPSTSGPLVVNLKLLTRNNDGLSNAIRQASSYCTTRGVKLAVVSNGHQLVAFVGSRNDGIPPMTGRAVAFRSLAEMDEHFVDLWNYLSPDGIAFNNLENVLRLEPRALPPEKLSKSLWVYPGIKARNTIELELDVLGELFLQDIVKAKELEDEFLRECYCTSGALSQYALITKDILKSRYHETVNRSSQQVVPVTDNTGLTPQLWESLVKRGVSRRPIVLLGDVGVGKTTFIRRLVKIDAKQELEKALVFYIDFGSEPALRRDLEQYVAETFSKQLEKEYGLDIYEDSFVRAVYNGELNGLAKGIYGRFRTTDPNRYLDKEIERLEQLTSKLETHLRRSFEHLRATESRSAVVFFDNIDQREVEFQDAVYLVAQSMSENWGLTTFVSLRPETFNTSRRSGSLAAYQPRVFVISPPQIDEVVKKRLQFAQSVIAIGSFSLGAEGVTLDSDLLRDYIAVLIFSLSRNTELCECLDNVSAGNVRRALDLLTSFVGSGHVDTDKILRAWRGTSRYIIPLHEFLRAIIYGDSEFYDPASSPIPNAYDITSRNPREHFAMPILLNYLHRQAQRGSVELGFVLLAKVYEHFQALGYTVEDIEHTVERSVESGLIESSVGAASDRPRGAERLRLRQSGAYLIRRLLRQFVYYDAVVVDTPILTDTVRPLLTSAGFILDRLDRADRFLDYLTNQFEVFDSLDTGLDFPELATAAKSDVAVARARVLKAEEVRQRQKDAAS